MGCPLPPLECDAGQDILQVGRKGSLQEATELFLGWLLELMAAQDPAWRPQ